MMDHGVDGRNSHFHALRYDHLEPHVTTAKQSKQVRASFFPPIALAPRAKSPMYRQLYDWFQRSIVSGQLRPGQRVPSTRSLAAELKVSRVPVLSAFEQLHAEGYLETFIGAGTCVASSIPEDSKPAPGVARKPATTRISRKVSQRARHLMSMQGDSDLKNIGAFRVSLPALDYFPVGVWSSLLSRHSRNSTREMMAYGDPMGYAPFREAIAEYLGASRAVRCNASQIIVVPGSQLGLQVSARALLDLDDPVWIEEPGYPGAQQALTMAGARLVPVPIDRDGLDVKEGIRRCRNARAVYITPSHQYPMGATMSASRRMQLLNWAARNGSWIIEDDYDSEYRFGSHPVASLQGMDADARVIYIGTLSKVLFPALRLGYVVVPKDLVRAFYSAREATDIFSPTLYQAALTDFIKEGHFARHIRRMRVLYLERRKALGEAIRKHLGEQLEVVNAEAGMHLVALLPPGVNDRTVSRKAAEAGISVIPLSSCYLKRLSRGGLVLGYGGANTNQIEDGVQILAKIIREVASPN
jgi:GntR family transcriptional regulator/MocR family aminotransferase